MSLAKQGKIQEAMTLCRDAAKSKGSLTPVMTIIEILCSGRAGPKDFQSAEPLLQKALAEHKNQPDLMANLAVVRVLQDRPAEAIELYRQVLRLQPKNIGVLNNLASLLAEKPEPQARREALEYVEQAIDLAGKQPLLLDTKGMALLYDGEAERAVKMLQSACDYPRPDPRFLFHLAAACARLDQLDRARAALRKARDADLERQVLTKKDRQLLADLDRQLGT